MAEDLYWSIYHHQRCGTCVGGWHFKPNCIQLITFVGNKACGGISTRFGNYCKLELYSGKDINLRVDETHLL